MKQDNPLQILGATLSLILALFGMSPETAQFIGLIEKGEAIQLLNLPIWLYPIMAMIVSASKIADSLPPWLSSFIDGMGMNVGRAANGDPKISVTYKGTL